MALFSFRHDVRTFSPKAAVGRQAAKGQTAAHLRYICRKSAARLVLKERLPSSSHANLGKRAEADAERRRGRVCERFIIALPLEASPDQREDLVRAFADRITGGKAGYVAAIHDQAGNDVRNPHAHLVCFDKHEKTGGRGRPRSVIGMARKNAVEKAARCWSETHNTLMRAWGYSDQSMIDSRSFAERGVPKIPTIHEGAAARAVASKGLKPRGSQEWSKIDEGQSRAAANRLIRKINHDWETLNERANRLGGGHEGDGVRCKSRGSSVGKDRGGRSRATGSPPPPFLGNPSDSRNNRDRSLERRTGSKPPYNGTISGGEVSPPLAIRRYSIRGWVSIRRIFRELTMLHSVLRSRIAHHVSTQGTEIPKENRPLCIGEATPTQPTKRIELTPTIR